MTSIPASAVEVVQPYGEPGLIAVPVPGGAFEMHAHGLNSTRYPGLPPVDACSQDTEEYRRRAHDHHYGDDVALMCREHEATHHLLARLLRLPASPTLHGIATGEHWPHWPWEEAAVLAFQRYARVVGADIVGLLAGEAR